MHTAASHVEVGRDSALSWAVGGRHYLRCQCLLAGRSYPIPDNANFIARGRIWHDAPRAWNWFAHPDTRSHSYSLGPVGFPTAVREVMGAK